MNSPGKNPSVELPHVATPGQMCCHDNPARLKAWQRDFSSPGVDYHMPKAYRGPGYRCAP